jgi:hypothetical protein
VVVSTVLEALGRSSTAADIARAFWQQTGTFRVKRAEPVWTPRGKFQTIRRGGQLRAGQQRGASAESPSDERARTSASR